MKEKYIYPIVITVLSFVTRFFFLGYPNQVVFDETHYGLFASQYLTHTHFFDLHPPLLKLLAALSAYIGGFNPNFDFARIGEVFVDPNFIFLRIVPAIAGFLLPVVIYYLAREIGISRLCAFFAGLIVVFENSLLVQSKFLLIDGALIFFGFASILFYFLFKNHKNKYYLLVSALLLGATISTKWTGLAFLAIILLIELASWIHERKTRHFNNLLVLTLIPILFYMGTFAIHFNLLTKLGPGDAFMSQNFQQKSFLGKFFELNETMFIQNATLTTTHPYSSRWYSWPIMKRPIFYWENGNEKIYSTGNPFIYWLSLLAVLVLFMHTLFRTRFFQSKRHVILFILFGYCINFLPYVILRRISFTYYYLAALIFAILALSIIIDSLKSRRIKIISVITLLILFTLTFLYFAPLTYGFPLSPNSFQNHLWFKTWQ